MLEHKRKGNMRKNNNTTRGNKPESTGERMKIKKVSSNDKTIQTKYTFQNNERKFYQQLGDETKTYQQPMQKKPNDFGQKYGIQKHMTRELEELE